MKKRRNCKTGSVGTVAMYIFQKKVSTTMHKKPSIGPSIVMISSKSAEKLCEVINHYSKICE